MSHARAARAALVRTVVVLTMFSGGLLGTAGTSSATPANEVTANTSGTTVSSGPAIAGVSLGTVTWALVGFALLVLGLIAASRSGRRNPAGSPPTSLTSVIASAPFQSSAPAAQGEPTSAVIA